MKQKVNWLPFIELVEEEDDNGKMEIKLEIKNQEAIAFLQKM